MTTLINADALKNFGLHHYNEEDNKNYKNIKTAKLEFDWIEFELEEIPEEKKDFYNKLKQLKGIEVTFSGNKHTQIDKYGQTGKQSSNVELVSNILNYLGENKKQTLIIVGSGCDAPSVWTFGDAISQMDGNVDKKAIVETWAKKIIESASTPAVTTLVKLVNKYDTFTVLTTNVTRSFELSGIKPERLVRLMDNKIEWINKKRGEVKINIGSKRTRRGEKFSLEMKKPDAIIAIGYGFVSQEKMYVDHYPCAHLIIFDKRDF